MALTLVHVASNFLVRGTLLGLLSSELTVTDFNFVFARPAKVVDSCLCLVVILGQVHLQVVVANLLVAITRSLAKPGQQTATFLLVFLHHLNDIVPQHVVLGVKMALSRYHH